MKMMEDPPIKQVEGIQIVEIEQIIKERFCAAQQKLNLCGASTEWKVVLFHRKWDQLKYLNLKNCEISDDELVIIKNSKWPHLQSREIGMNYIRSISNLTLVECPQLIKLYLDHNKLRKSGLKKFIDYPLTQIVTLSLSGNPVGSRGAKLFSKADLPLLQWLDVCTSQFSTESCKLNNEGLKHLSKAKWQKLKGLQLRYNNIRYGGIKELNKFSIKKVIKLQVNKTENIYEVLYVMISDANKSVIIDNFGNRKLIERGVGSILANSLRQQ